MYFKQFSRNIYSEALQQNVVEHVSSRGHAIHLTEQGVYIDGQLSEFSTIQQALDFVKEENDRFDIHEEISRELYEDMPDVKIASLINEHHGDYVKVTDKLVEAYVSLAAAKTFTTDPVIRDIRNINKIDRIHESYVDFILNDGSSIAITEQVYNKINNIIGEHQDIVNYMRESKDNFIKVLNQIEE